ncbi:hypothetical protein BD410DRAFT_876456 [Rickenella mellea]|uniref:Uncharacterized protein n=1 Tax=Rickenella mellea TaxID=50990 RepID=A0A4Y7PWS6_9AGAM|nr:hypothetical protein BD410DRAFT_876456 [Rickenella mellea]
MPAGTLLKSHHGTTSPFFHAHLQRVWPMDDDGGSSDMPAPFLEGLRNGEDQATHWQGNLTSTPSSPQSPPSYSISQPSSHIAFKDPQTEVTTSSSQTQTQTQTTPITSPLGTTVIPTLAMPMEPFDHRFTDYFSTEMDISEPYAAAAERRYHYLTRSQSALTYPSKPSLHNYNTGSSASLYNISPSPLRDDFDPREPDSSRFAAERFLSPNRTLSPIEEQTFFPHESGSLSHRAQGDNASLHSTSTSTFPSKGSTPHVSPVAPPTPVTPVDPSAGFPKVVVTGPAPGVVTAPPKHTRSFSMLPVIPASPRVSQATSGADQQGPGLPPGTTYPPALTIPPFSFPGPLSVYQPYHEAWSHASPQFEIDIAEYARAAQSRTPSLLSRSESLQTELTYLTAPDSIRTSLATVRPETRRFSSFSAHVHARTLETIGDHAEESSAPPCSPARTFSLKGIGWTPDPKASIAAGWLAACNIFNSIRERVPALPELPDFPKLNISLPTVKNDSKPRTAEVLFWMGFMGPWCWLIGGWVLARDGAAVDDARISVAKTRSEHGSTTMLPLWYNGGSRVALGNSAAKSASGSTPRSERTASKSFKGMIDVVLASSLETIGSARSARSTSKTTHAAKLRPVNLEAGTTSSRTTYRKELDMWVSRCRVAAVMSGVLILAVTIVALVFLARTASKKSTSP